jgi:acetolactate synthase-1/2/3 large subunit
MHREFESALLPPGLEGQGVDPGVVVQALKRHLPTGSIITSDAGNFSGWIERYLPLPDGARYLAPTSGAMGYALPAAVAASRIEPGRCVVAVCGDGGFAMTMSELETAVRIGATPLVLVFDNRMYGTIRSHAGDGPGASSTILGEIDAAGIAHASGAYGASVRRSAEVDSAIRVAMRQPRAAVVHLACGPRSLSVR